MKLYAKFFILLATIRLFESLLNINRKKLSSYDSKRFTVLDDRYYKIVFVSDAVLCIGIVLISLLSSRINSMGLYSATCSFMALISMKVTMSISFNKMYIKKLR